MECPHCHQSLTAVTNSRATKQNTQIWRRRRCLHCDVVFTTHEVIDLSHLKVSKKAGYTEMYSRIKLYSGIYGSTIGLKIANREKIVDKVTREVERNLLFLKQNKIASSLIADYVLKILRKTNTAIFLRYLSYCKNITSETDMKKQLHKYALN